MAVPDLVVDRGAVGAIEPVTVGQVRRARTAIALAVGAVAGRAVVGEERRGAGDGGRVGRAAATGARHTPSDRRPGPACSISSRPKAGICDERVSRIARAHADGDRVLDVAPACRPTARRRRSGWDSPWRPARPRRGRWRNCRRRSSRLRPAHRPAASGSCLDLLAARRWPAAAPRRRAGRVSASRSLLDLVAVGWCSRPWV